MSIVSFDMSGYRCFREKQTLSLGRLTLVYGRNNTGKSALIRLPPLIAGSMSGTPGLNLQHPAVNRASFRDLIWRRAVDGDLLEVGLTLANEQRWGWGLEWREQLRQGAPVHLDVPNSPTRWSWAPKTRAETGPVRTFQSEAGDETEVSLEGLRSTGLADSTTLDDALTGIRWLTAIRKGPLRHGLPDGSRPEPQPDGGIWAEGEVQDSEVRSGVSAWFERETDYRIVLSPSEGSTRVRLQPVAEAAPDIPFPDAGEGLQQVFPVIVALEALRSNGGLLCVEEPEAHLHPGLQRALAHRIVEVLQQAPKAQVLLETHSETFLYEALLAAVDTLRGAVSLNWVETGADGASSVTQIELDDRGRPLSNTLVQAFSDVGSLRREVIEARRAHAG